MYFLFYFIIYPFILLLCLSQLHLHELELLIQI